MRKRMRKRKNWGTEISAYMFLITLPYLSAKADSRPQACSADFNPLRIGRVQRAKWCACGLMLFEI